MSVKVRKGPGDGLLENLHSTTSEYQYQGRQHFLDVLSSEYNLLKMEIIKSQYIIFSDVDYHTYLHDFAHSDEKIFSKSYYAYIPASHLLLVKMTTEVHEEAYSELNKLITLELGQMGLANDLRITAQAHYQSSSGVRKKADTAYKPRVLPPTRVDYWPSMVMESGYSEAKAKLASDSRWWLDVSSGDVKTALTISVHKTKREITIETWVLIDRPTRNEPHRKVPEVNQRVVISQQTTDLPIRVTGSVPLVIPLSSLLLREPSGNEWGIWFTRDQLEGYAELVWEAHPGDI